MLALDGGAAGYSHAILSFRLPKDELAFSKQVDNANQDSVRMTEESSRRTQDSVDMTQDSVRMTQESGGVTQHLFRKT